MSYGEQPKVLKVAGIVHAPGTTPQHIGATEGAYRHRSRRPLLCQRCAPGQPPIPCPGFPDAITDAITDVGEAVSWHDDRTDPKTRSGPLARIIYCKPTSDRTSPTCCRA